MRVSVSQPMLRVVARRFKLVCIGLRNAAAVVGFMFEVLGLMLARTLAGHVLTDHRVT